MRDFTHETYKRYLMEIKNNYDNVLKFCDYLSLEPKPEKFVLIRHDVDRNYDRAYQMALIEKNLGINTSYYFRDTPSSFNREVALNLDSMGHEIGFHYESYSLANGNRDKALNLFGNSLSKFREFIPVKTISMHGSPLSKYNNLDLWTKESNIDYKKHFNLLGDAVLDIDYSDIAYIGDTGRNWSVNRANVRDKVNSYINPEINNSNDLINCFSSAMYPKLCFQIHPERWTSGGIDYYLQKFTDFAVNSIKFIINKS